MNRSRTQLDTYPNRPLAIHKPGVIPYSSQPISPISSKRHKYELKQKIWPKQTVESWFAKHSFDDRRAVYSFLNTLYDGDADNHHEKDDRLLTRSRQRSPTPRLSTRMNTADMRPSRQPRALSSGRHESRSSKRDLGEILQSLESFHPSSSVRDKGIQTLTTPITTPLPDVNGTKKVRQTEKRSRSSTALLDKYTEKVQHQVSTDNSSDVNTNQDNDENNNTHRRYLSQTWRVINPREDAEQNVRPENNRSSFFNYTKKVYPEYFFIHPDWY